METTRTSLPELPLERPDEPATPEIGPGNIITGEARLDLGDPSVEFVAIGDHARLR